MKIVYFTHSLRSCWNHGNAHFLRGVLRDLARRGHDVTACEPRNAWSVENLVADHGKAGLEPFEAAYPDLASTLIEPRSMACLERVCDRADLVIVHEWNDPALVSAIGRLKRNNPFTLLFHDTHHRAVSDPDSMLEFDLGGYDGVLAFGEALAGVYRGWGWGERVFVWHEAADVTVFGPPPEPAPPRDGLVWIGNWGDGERSQELETFLLAPAQRADLPLDIHGVRYPAEALSKLARFGARYHGWIANPAAPEVFARRLATVHVPRRFYAQSLPGIPTIRVFEALACGIPLVCAPWRDSEELFRPGKDYLVAGNGEVMTRHLMGLAADPDWRASLACAGLETILARHTCAHRVDELLGIAARLAPKLEPAPRLEAVS